MVVCEWSFWWQWMSSSMCILHHVRIFCIFRFNTKSKHRHFTWHIVKQNILLVIFQQRRYKSSNNNNVVFASYSTSLSIKARWPREHSKQQHHQPTSIDNTAVRSRNTTTIDTLCSFWWRSDTNSAAASCSTTPSESATATRTWCHFHGRR